MRYPHLPMLELTFSLQTARIYPVSAGGPSKGTILLDADVANLEGRTAQVRNPIQFNSVYLIYNAALG
jgi:hypothetical protein